MLNTKQHLFQTSMEKFVDFYSDYYWIPCLSPIQDFSVFNKFLTVLNGKYESGLNMN